MTVVPVRIERDGYWQTVDIHELTDDELVRWAEERSALEGWQWARMFASLLADREGSEA